MIIVLYFTFIGFIYLEFCQMSLKLDFAHNYAIRKYLVHLTVFWCFQGVEKGCIGSEWVNMRSLKTSSEAAWDKSSANLEESLKFRKFHYYWI